MGPGDVNSSPRARLREPVAPLQMNQSRWRITLIFDLVLRFSLFVHCLLIVHTSLPAIAKCAEAPSFVVVSLTFYVLKFFMVNYLVSYHSRYLCQPGRKCRTSDLKLGEDLWAQFPPNSKSMGQSSNFIQSFEPCVEILSDNIPCSRENPTKTTLVNVT